jgi:tetratricopeptide (TPR) repeat protein
MNKLFIIYLGLSFAFCCVSSNKDKIPIPTDNELRRMDWHEFDQTDHSGWRVFMDNSEYKIAAKLIDKYIQLHPDLDPTYKKVSLFHKGQMLASAGEYQKAAESFKKSFRGNPKAEEDKLMLWDVYALTMIAFLEKDKARFKKYHEIYKKYSENNQSIRLNLLKKMSENFEKPYIEITESIRAKN